MRRPRPWGTFSTCLARFFGAALAFGILATWLPCGTQAMAGDATAHRSTRMPIRGIFYNEDDSHRFVLDPPGKMKPERLDQLVDELADSQVTVMLICCNAKNTGYASNVWDVHCRGFDPAKGDDQPYFGDVPKEDRETLRRWAHNLKAMLDAGIDPMQRMIDRCRTRRISPWVSIRMNDVHDAHLLRSPLHSRMWMEHHEYWRYPDRFSAWNDRCFNYALQPVRDHAMGLVREVCERYDMDGLELDWNRFPLHFREGEEIQQGKVLTEWMSAVRDVVRQAEKKWKHPIWLVARVPARPEVAYGTGLDAVAWAKRGLVDHLVVAPFWATTDYDIPVERWLDLLKGTGVGVTAGLEIRVEPYPGAPVLANTPQRRRGAAMAHLARGSHGIYVFNYFEGRSEAGSELWQLFNEMHSVDALARQDRSYVVTFVDINIPGKPIPPALPKRLSPNESAEFKVFIGPKPLAPAKGEVQLTLKAEKPQERAPTRVTLNGHAPDETKSTFGADAFCDGYNTIRVINTSTSPLGIEGVELAIRFPRK